MIKSVKFILVRFLSITHANFLVYCYYYSKVQTEAAGLKTKTHERQRMGCTRTRSGLGSQRESACLRFLISRASSTMESRSSRSTST